MKLLSQPFLAPRPADGGQKLFALPGCPTAFLLGLWAGPGVRTFPGGCCSGFRWCFWAVLPGQRGRGRRGRRLAWGCSGPGAVVVQGLGLLFGAWGLGLLLFGVWDCCGLFGAVCPLLTCIPPLCASKMARFNVVFSNLPAFAQSHPSLPPLSLVGEVRARPAALFGRLFSRA